MTNPKAPLIGMTCRSRRYKAWSESSLGSWMDFVYRDYSNSILAAGGIPTGVPAGIKNEALLAIVDRLDGLMLCGGPDVYPPLYGQEMQPGLGVVFRELDEMEVALVRRAVKNDVPVLGICRGIQVIAVAFGGELYQDIDNQYAKDVLHTQTAANDAFAHRVKIASDSQLARIIGDQSIWVNSHHHQAVKEMPDGFRVVAWASDHLVEAIEKPDSTFCIGVQWHPEGTAPSDPSSQRLFSAFVKAAAQKQREQTILNHEKSTPKAAGF